MFQKIDAHSHFYPAFMGPTSDIDVYMNESKNLDIEACVASPGPCPQYPLQNGVLYKPCKWRFENKKFVYYQEFSDAKTGELLEDKLSSTNPFHDVNVKLLNESQKRRETDPVKILVMPLYHPKLDSIEEVSALLAYKNVVALKVHGVAMASSPSDMKPEIIRALLKTNKSLIVHTDTYKNPVTLDIHRTYVMNDPVDWVRWAIDTGVKVLITHGARLSAKAIHLARGHKNIVIGLSPGILIQNSDQERLVKNTTNFEFDVMSMINPDQLVFDIDFGWNIINRGEWDVRDWLMEERINQIADQIGITNTQLNQIYYANAAEFFALEKLKF